MWKAIKRLGKFLFVMYAFIFMMMLGMVIMTNLMLQGLDH